MSYKEKERSMPFTLKRIENLTKLHPKEAGLIHTGSYEFQTKLKQYAFDKGIDERFIWCTNAKEKVIGVERIKWDIETNGWSNRILVGASLLEGVNLKDDLCRFNVFMKAPFPSLGDELVKKMYHVYGKDWYNWVTMQSIIQGIGRSNRHINDYSTTYLLDGSFEYFLQSCGIVPSYIQKRVMCKPTDSLFSELNDVNTPPPHSPNFVSSIDKQAKLDFEETERINNSIIGGSLNDSMADIEK